MARASVFISAVLVGVSGCGGSNLAPISGRVLVDGKPMENLIVVFQPIGGKDNPNPGKGSAGRTDKDGRFTLYQDENVPGAVVGKHKVAIFTALSDKQLRSDPEVGSPDGAAPGPKEIIPTKYNDMTTLTFDVTAGGTDQANFDLDTDRAKKK